MQAAPITWGLAAVRIESRALRSARGRRRGQAAPRFQLSHRFFFYFIATVNPNPSTTGSQSGRCPKWQIAYL